MNDTNKDLLTTVCLNCGGKIEFSNKEDLVNCPFCGAGYSVSDLLNESDSVRIEKIKSQAYKDVESGKQQIEMERLKHEIEKEKKQEDKDSVDSFKKSKLSKVLIVFSIISVLLCVFAFLDGKVLSGIIAAIMAFLFLMSFLMGLHIFKEKKKGIRVIATIVAFLLIVPYFNLYDSKDKSEKITWSDFELCDILPEPESTVGKIILDSKDELMLYVYKTDKDGYKDYLSECENMGFVVESEKSESSYNAFNKLGYKLELRYSKNNEELHIDLSAPIEMSTFEMPNSEIAKLLPVPNSNIGNILIDKSDSFEAYVGEISFDNYNEYVKACSENGFNIDYDKGDKYYTADNETGYTLRLEYEGFNIIYISVRAPKENSDEKETESVNTSKQEEKTQTTSKKEEKVQTTSKDKADNDNISIGVTPEFKETMDSYEAFFDEYVEFMKKYSESDNALEMLDDYSDFMTKYNETMEKLNSIKEEELSEADAAYYTEVMLRINKKLIEVS